MDKKILLVFIITNSLINIISTKNLQCSNNILINVGLLSTKGLSLKNNSNNSRYQSKITKEEREKYEQIIDLKKSFSASMSLDSENFCPEKESYFSRLNHITFIFFIIALFPLIFIIIYLILRFLLKKCTGPKKSSDINRFYRNSTWVLSVLLTLTIFILFTIILADSVKTYNAVKKTFDRASDLINNNDRLYGEISKTINFYKNNNLTTPDNELMESFKANINKYVDVTKEHTDEIKKSDYNRNVGMILLYVYYLIVMILTFVFFFLKWKIGEGALFILLLFTVPAMLIFEGYNSKFFFFYSDLCGSINGALYNNQFPVAGQSLGYYYNCFDKQTKAELYGIRFSLYKIGMESDDDVHKNARNEYNSLNKNELSPQLNCQLVTEIVPKIEDEFCKDNLERIYDMLKLMSWLIFLTLLFAICVRRLENLIWKKKNEIESMIENLESIY